MQFERLVAAQDHRLSVSPAEGHEPRGGVVGRGALPPTSPATVGPTSSCRVAPSTVTSTRTHSTTGTTTSTTPPLRCSTTATARSSGPHRSDLARTRVVRPVLEVAHRSGRCRETPPTRHIGIWGDPNGRVAIETSACTNPSRASHRPVSAGTGALRCHRATAAAQMTPPRCRPPSRTPIQPGR